MIGDLGIRNQMQDSQDPAIYHSETYKLFTCDDITKRGNINACSGANVSPFILQHIKKLKHSLVPVLLLFFKSLHTLETCHLLLKHNHPLGWNGSWSNANESLKLCEKQNRNPTETAGGNSGRASSYWLSKQHMWACSHGLTYSYASKKGYCVNTNVWGHTFITHFKYQAPKFRILP